jgi:hypothetical protein
LEKFQPGRTPGGSGVHDKDLLLKQREPPIETYDAVEMKYCVLERRGGDSWMDAEIASRYH